jgi:hypothetical protein
MKQRMRSALRLPSSNLGSSTNGAIICWQMSMVTNCHKLVIFQFSQVCWLGSSTNGAIICWQMSMVTNCHKLVIFQFSQVCWLGSSTNGAIICWQMSMVTNCHKLVIFQFSQVCWIVSSTNGVTIRRFGTSNSCSLELNPSLETHGANNTPAGASLKDCE